jgi:hypothetical protein
MREDAMSQPARDARTLGSFFVIGVERISIAHFDLLLNVVRVSLPASRNSVWQLGLKTEWKHALSFLFPHVLLESETKTSETNMKAAITGDGYEADTWRIHYENRHLSKQLNTLDCI